MKEFRRENFSHQKTRSNQKRASVQHAQPVAMTKRKPYVPKEIKTSLCTHQPRRDARRRAKCSTSKQQVRTDWI